MESGTIQMNNKNKTFLINENPLHSQTSADFIEKTKILLKNLSNNSRTCVKIAVLRIVHIHKQNFPVN